MNTNQPLAISTSQPLCYRIPGVELIDVLPYIQQQGQLSQIQKNKVNYLLKQQQKILEAEIFEKGYKNIKEYYESQQLLLKNPKQVFTQSQHFKNEVIRIKNSLQNKQQAQKASLYPLIQVKLQKQAQVSVKKNKKKQTKKQKAVQNNNQYEKQLEDRNIGKISRGYNELRQLQLLMSSEIAPHLLKGFMASLDKQQASIDKQIQRQQQLYEQINKKRRYQQLQAEQRFNTINDRIKIMMYKKIKPNELI